MEKLLNVFQRIPGRPGKHVSVAQPVCPRRFRAAVASLVRRLYSIAMVCPAHPPSRTRRPARSASTPDVRENFSPGFTLSPVRIPCYRYPQKSRSSRERCHVYCSPVPSPVVYDRYPGRPGYIVLRVQAIPHWRERKTRRIGRAAGLSFMRHRLQSSSEVIASPSYHSLQGSA
jgi:hypothetical protein